MFNRLNPWHQRVPYSYPSEFAVFGRKYTPDFVPGGGVGGGGWWWWWWYCTYWILHKKWKGEIAWTKRVWKLRWIRRVMIAMGRFPSLCLSSVSTILPPQLGLHVTTSRHSSSASPYQKCVCISLIPTHGTPSFNPIPLIDQPNIWRGAQMTKLPLPVPSFHLLSNTRFSNAPGNVSKYRVQRGL